MALAAWLVAFKTPQKFPNAAFAREYLLWFQWRGRRWRWYLLLRRMCKCMSSKIFGIGSFVRSERDTWHIELCDCIVFYRFWIRYKIILSFFFFVSFFKIFVDRVILTYVVPIQTMASIRTAVDHRFPANKYWLASVRWQKKHNQNQWSKY